MSFFETKPGVIIIMYICLLFFVHVYFIVLSLIYIHIFIRFTNLEIKQHRICTHV